MHLHLDFPGGVAGDMLLGALSDLLDDDTVVGAVPDRLKLPGVHVAAARVTRHGIQARQVCVRVDGSPPHRHLTDIIVLLDAAEIPGVVRERAVAVFRRLAAAEARVHGTDIESVHFHEVGADDALVDIVGTCLLVEQLGVCTITGGTLPLGRGVVKAAHGHIPVPAPATVELLTGWPVEWLDQPGERVTPTGAALVTTLAEARSPGSGTLVRTGYGAGTRDFEDRANLVRASLLDVEAPGRDEVVELVAVIDDATGEQLAHAAQLLLGAGALDVYYAPLVMKKGRPGWQLTVIAGPADADALADAVLLHSGSAGLRYRRTARVVLARRWVTVKTRWGAIRIKEFDLPGGGVRAVPEFEDCRSVAEQAAVTLEQVQTAASAAYRRERGDS